MSIGCNNQGNIETIRFPFGTGNQKPYIKQGDTIPSWSGSAPDWPFDLTSEGIEINFQLYKNKQRIGSYSVGNGITIDSSIKFIVDRIPTNNFPEGDLFGDLEISWLDGETRLRKTFFNMQYTILKEYTKV